MFGLKICICANAIKGREKMSAKAIIVISIVITIWVCMMGCIIWLNLAEKDEKTNKIKLRKFKNYYIGRLEALEEYCSVSKEIKKRWGYVYIHLLGCKQNNQRQTKKQWKIRNSEAYKLGWEDFANLKMRNIPTVCRMCGQPKHDFYCLGNCRSCRSYNGSQDLLWEEKSKEEVKKLCKYIHH